MVWVRYVAITLVALIAALVLLMLLAVAIGALFRAL